MTRILLAVSGLSQQQVAHLSGISPGTLSRYLRGERAVADATERRIVEAITRQILTPREGVPHGRE